MGEEVVEIDEANEIAKFRENTILRAEIAALRGHLSDAMLDLCSRCHRVSCDRKSCNDALGKSWMEALERGVK